MSHAPKVLFCFLQCFCLLPRSFGRGLFTGLLTLRKVVRWQLLELPMAPRCCEDINVLQSAIHSQHTVGIDQPRIWRSLWGRVTGIALFQNDLINKVAGYSRWTTVWCRDASTHTIKITEGQSKNYFGVAGLRVGQSALSICNWPHVGNIWVYFNMDVLPMYQHDIN